MRVQAASILAPKGERESRAILKYCMPKGMPTIVMQSTVPMSALVSASSIPVNRNHATFSRNEVAFESNFISLPKGENERVLNLKHCRPMGMPTIVMHQSSPAKSQPSVLMNPPSTNQRILKRIRIFITFPCVVFVFCMFIRKNFRTGRAIFYFNDFLILPVTALCHPLQNASALYPW